MLWACHPLGSVARQLSGQFVSQLAGHSANGFDLGSRLGREKRRTDVTFVFAALAAVSLAAAVGLSRVWEPALP